MCVFPDTYFLVIEFVMKIAIHIFSSDLVRDVSQSHRVREVERRLYMCVS